MTVLSTAQDYPSKFHVHGVDDAVFIILINTQADKEMIK